MVALGGPKNCLPESVLERAPKHLAASNRAISNPNRAISNYAISNRCDLGGLRCDSFSKTIDFHCFCYAYGSEHYVPTSIWDAKKYTFYVVVMFL